MPRNKELLNKVIEGRSSGFMKLPTVKTEFSCNPSSMSLDTRYGIEIIGRYFRNEFDYDFPPYEANFPGNQDREIHLLTEYNSGDPYASKLYGCIEFQRGIYGNVAHDIWILTWVWLHPFFRNRGELSRAWPGIGKRHGPFIVQPPISTAMRSFLSTRKTGEITTTDGKQTIASYGGATNA